VLPIQLAEADIDELFRRAKEHEPYQITVDLESQTISDEHGWQRHFDVDASRRHNLLHGLDDIAQTLQHEEKISAYEAARQW
jgi:3-isopropylmalate/(R)-2-methylmalate dehydratase small subunit